MNGQAIKINRSDDFKQAADELSGFIHGLNLSKQDNDKLIKLMVRQIEIAEHDTYLGLTEKQKSA